jgi:cytochrome c oxidase subunit IV
MSHGHASHHASPHVAAVRTYALVFGALLVMTAITTVVASRDLGPLNNAVALGIAVLKASLVVLYFMHAKGSPRLTKLVIAAALLWLALLFGLTLVDYATREPVGPPIAGDTFTRYP